jgi:hypothetical protein
VLIAAGLAIEGYTIYVAGLRPLSQLELMLSQALALILSLAGSFVAGMYSAREAGIEIIRPHGRKAFRRRISLNDGLLRLRTSIVARRAFLATVVDKTALGSGSLHRILGSRSAGELRS